MQLYHNANASDVDSFPTHCDGTKWQREREAEWNCLAKNADIGYKSTLVIVSRPDEGMHLGTHPWTYTDI
jgi:hypothetical protein